MILTICGKGGCGKSTITTLLAREFSNRGKKVLVMDCDESNFGLQLQLGMDLPESLTDYVGGKGQIIEYLAGGRANIPQLIKGEFTIDTIPGEVYSEKEGIKLMTPGKIQQANEAGACAFSVIVSQFIEKLKIEDNEIVILDMEAGTEHFGRGTDNISDAILMIVDSSYESLCLSEKIAGMSESIEKKTYFILNKVTEDDEPVMREKVSKNGTIAAVIPFNRAIQRKGLVGEAIDVQQPEIAGAVEILLQEHTA
ncbi:MAG: P-loop NTPase [Lachnospiraceae bacterium]|nr:P-loop NTPase [Lachnospiraceae bacterium]